MASMLERMARALLPHIASTYEGYDARWDDPLDRASAYEAARLVIPAMRELSDAMKALTPMHATDVECMWQKMLDMVLLEDPGDA